MNEPTSREVAKTLFLPSAGPELQVRMLTAVVMDLMMELEALRDAMVAQPGYRQAYRKTALLVHDSAGCSMGLDKLIDRFYPHGKDASGRVWWESLMLRRLGFSEDEVSAYREEAKGMELRT